MDNTTKKCSICKIERSLKQFAFRKDQQKYRNDCNVCKSNRNKKYRENHREELNNYAKNVRYKYKGRYNTSAYVRKYRKRHPERSKEQGRKRRLNPNHRIKSNLRSRLRDILRKQGAVKSDRTMNLIGCSIEYLMNYLESKFYNKKLSDGQEMSMTRELMSTPIIELDHVIPLWKFDLTIPEEQKLAFHYTNLQPMWSQDHNIKSGKDYSEYCKWKSSKLSLQEYLKFYPR